MKNQEKAPALTPDQDSVFDVLTAKSGSAFDLLYQVQGMGYTLKRALQSYEPLEDGDIEAHQQELELHVEAMASLLKRAIEGLAHELDLIPAA